MHKSISKLVLAGAAAIVLACLALATNAAPDDTAGFAPVIVSDDFRIEVETNRNAYQTGDVLSLAVRLLNNSPHGLSIGVCPMTATADSIAAQAEETDTGLLDDTPVDVVITPPQPIVIGYATLTRIGPSPVPLPEFDADDATDIEPKAFKLPLFGASNIPGHSTRIISVANILLKAPPAKSATAATDSEAADAIPAVGRYIPLKRGYYLLDCHIEKVCDVQPAQAQKIIHIKPRVIKPLPKPEPKPVPVPTPKSAAGGFKKSR